MQKKLCCIVGNKKGDKMNQWQGKKWYCYGTSVTDNVSLTSAGVNCGTYSKYLAQYAGLEEHNFGIGGSGIIPKLHGDDSIKTRCMCLTDGKEEAGLGYYRVVKDNTLVRDQIHLTEKGGEVLAKYFWGKLKNMYPNEKT